MTVEDVAFGPANLGFDYHTIMERINRAMEDMRLKGLEQRAPHRLRRTKQATAIAEFMPCCPNHGAGNHVYVWILPVGACFNT